MKSDIESGSGVSIDLAHEQVHAGWHFSGSQTSTVGANTSYNCIFHAGTNKPHVIFGCDATGAGDFILFEGATPSTDTGQSTIVLYNNDRNNTANTTGCTFRAYNTSAMPSTSLGTVIDRHVFGGTAGPFNSNIGGGVGQRHEWILKSNQSYILQFNNKNGAATTNCAIKVFYYERPLA